MPRWFSFWILGSLALLLLLQQVPYLNLILLVVGAAAWCGLLVHGFLLCLLFESVTGRVPRVLMIIPLAAYGGYFYLYLQQGREIEDKAREMQLSNPSAALPFDPDQYSLVLPASRAENLVQHYDVSVAYEVNANFRPEGYLSYRLIDHEQCVRARSLRDRLRGQKISPAAFLVGPVKFDNTFLSEACLLRFPEKPPLQQIVVAQRGDNAVWKHGRTIMEQFVDFSIDGRVFATYRTASVWRLSALPLPLIGCGLSGGSLSSSCSVDFHRTYQVIDGTPKNVDKTLHDSPESIVLGLRKFARGDYTQFKGDKRSAAFLEHIAAYSAEQDTYKAERREELFAQFVEFVRDRESLPNDKGVFAYHGHIEPPEEMVVAVNERSDKLPPLRDAIVGRYMQLIQGKIGAYSQWMSLLVRSLVALPRESYAAMPDDEVNQFLDLLGQQSFHVSKYLYLRIADAGPRTLGFYEQVLAKSQERYPPELAVAAICRIGMASDETRRLLRDKFTELSKSDNSNDGLVASSTIYITLLKLGDAAALETHLANPGRDDIVSWYDAIRQGRGRTDVGPNNCRGWIRPPAQGLDWPVGLRPSLAYNDGAWGETGTK